MNDACFFPVSDHALASSKNACDITLKHVLLPKLNLWQDPAKKLHQFLFSVFRYHNFTGTFDYLNVSKVDANMGYWQDSQGRLTLS